MTISILVLLFVYIGLLSDILFRTFIHKLKFVMKGNKFLDAHFFVRSENHYALSSSAIH